MQNLKENEINFEALSLDFKNRDFKCVRSFKSSFIKLTDNEIKDNPNYNITSYPLGWLQ